MLRLIHFKPRSRSAWRWLFVRLVETFPAGPTQTITGETVMVPFAITAWSGILGMPSFPDRDSALAWCEATGTMPDCVDTDIE